jgi:cell division septation protein DedD
MRLLSWDQVIERRDRASAKDFLPGNKEIISACNQVLEELIEERENKKHLEALGQAQTLHHEGMKQNHDLHGEAVRKSNWALVVAVLSLLVAALALFRDVLPDAFSPGSKAIPQITETQPLASPPPSATPAVSKSAPSPKQPSTATPAPQTLAPAPPAASPPPAVPRATPTAL